MSLKLFRALPRPLLKYAGIPLLACAVLMDNVSEGKLKILAFFLAASYDFRGTEKITDMITSRMGLNRVLTESRNPETLTGGLNEPNNTDSEQ